MSGAIATRTCFNIDFDNLADPTILGAAEAALLIVPGKAFAVLRSPAR
jgi:hypothetical protein